ncbi:efflux RND transporter periplasmic adaptor subunit [Vibrio sp. 10N.261.55.A7]|uniref:efflux RND transporter periplasmic adaptor subunit n=1 Tax=Vibrio TaxID=662 RepID=UPI000C817680|nr:efflux RND transporter periplasmic adaptor subunit [Vibrio sp. 10N.261.55.A7]PMJ93966.1 efflux transporter periplasmic adaptor subunit [Vibrio sp. 10N.261.55.A7]
MKIRDNSRLVKHATIVIVALLLQACKPETEHRTQPSLMVDTVTVGEPIVSQYRNFNGQTVAAELTPLSFQIEGEISSLLVQEGQSVRKGQTIAILDHTKQKQTLFDAQAKIELAIKQFSRGKELFAQEMISKAEYDELLANFKLAEANLGLAKSQMEYTRLVAPRDGVIGSVNKKIHENTAAGETVVTIYDSHQVYVKISLSDSVLATLDPNRNASAYKPIATFTGHDGEHSLGYLEHTNELHPETKTYELWMTMQQVEPPILPGTSVTVSVDMVRAGLNNVQGFHLPMTSIDTGVSSGDFYVWKLSNGVAAKTNISINQITSSGAVVSTGVQTGDVVINSNLRKLREGMKVQGVTP